LISAALRELQYAREVWPRNLVRSAQSLLFAGFEVGTKSGNNARPALIPSCVQMNATWYKGGGNRRPQVFENDGFPSFFKNFGVQRSTPVERNLV